MKNRILKSLCYLMVLTTSISCNKKIDLDEEPVYESTAICTVSSTTILEGTLYETPVYTFTSDTQGPKVAIVGGIHGDEVAGWKAAEKLININNYKGTVMIIPYANIVADTVVQRYVGYGNKGYIDNSRYETLSESERFSLKDVSSIKTTKFTDLNRIFPGKANGTVTEQIAYAIYSTIMDFKPNYVVDLHEARHNYEQSKADDSTYLGSTIVTGNSHSAAAALKICGDYNVKYEPDGDKYTEFIKVDGTTSTGDSYDNRFCKVMGEALKEYKTRALTIETNREVITNGYNPTDGRDVSYRINEQLRVIYLMLEQAYIDYEAGKFN